MPEECRTVKTQACLTTYKAVQPCFYTSEKDAERAACAKQKLDLDPIATEKGRCGANETCLENLRSKVFDLVKFRMYNLEYKAQELEHKGVSEDLIVGFIAAAEQKKIEFNEAQTIVDKKSIVQDVIKLWEDFVSKAKQQVRR